MSPLVNRITELMYPLTDFYTESGAAAPSITEIDGADMPQPYRGLLVHEKDMTPTLEAFCGQEIHLNRLKWREQDGALYRQVVLLAGEAEQPMEFGAIKIYLDRFSDGVRKVILDGHVPLGTILSRYQIVHTSKPTGYFQIAADTLMREVFGLDEQAVGSMLNGRHNILSDPDGNPLAEVVEVLPPLCQSGTPSHDQ